MLSNGLIKERLNSMARVITCIDEDGFWWSTDTDEWIRVSSDLLVISRRDTPKLSRRLRMALRVIRRRKDAPSKLNNRKGGLQNGES